MASHYAECALNTGLPPAKKLVLHAIADSANAGDRISHPGLPVIRRWSGLGRSQAMAMIAELVEDGYLVRHRPGVKGRNAEFIVWPHGCCPMHAPLPGYEARRLRDQTQGSGTPDPYAPAPAEPKGSGTSDPVEPEGSGTSDPVEEQGPAKGPTKGPVQTGPLTTSSPTTSTRLSTELTYPGPEQDHNPTPPLAEGGGGAASPAPWGTTSAPGPVRGPGYEAWQAARRALWPEPKPEQEGDPVPDTAPATGAM